MRPSQIPNWWAAGQAHLQANCPVMAKLIAAYPTSILNSRGEALESLLRAIVGQQISVLAAQSIWKKFHQATDTLTPHNVLKLSEKNLRECGLSHQKIKYMRGIAEGFANGTVHPGLWHNMPDEAIITELTRLPGIGRWTAEMFLIFHLLRPNVLPIGDLGLLKGYATAYATAYAEHEELYSALPPEQSKYAKQSPTLWRPLAHDLIKRSNLLWHPYCTMATWYLWRSLEPVEVN
jgi:DNA-3-methyladenine glycosylase II